MKLLHILPLILLSGLFFQANAQTGGMVKKQAAAPAAQTETFLVLGNCGMCEKIIEKAALGAGASTAAWDVDLDQLTVTFDPAKTSPDAIQKAVALAGYDNAGYKAPDSVYNNLHGCCQYDRSGAPGNAKTCAPEGQD